MKTLLLCSHHKLQTMTKIEKFTTAAVTNTNTLIKSEDKLNKFISSIKWYEIEKKEKRKRETQSASGLRFQPQPIKWVNRNRPQTVVSPSITGSLGPPCFLSLKTLIYLLFLRTLFYSSAPTIELDDHWPLIHGHPKVNLNRPIVWAQCTDSASVEFHQIVQRLQLGIGILEHPKQVLEQNHLAADDGGGPCLICRSGRLIGEHPEDRVVHQVGTDEVPSPGFSDIYLLEAFAVSVGHCGSPSPVIAAGICCDGARCAAQLACWLPLLDHALELAQFAPFGHFMKELESENRGRVWCRWNFGG